MPEVNANVTKTILSIVLNTETKVEWNDGNDCSSTTPKEITLLLSDLSAAAQEELQSKL